MPRIKHSSLFCLFLSYKEKSFMTPLGVKLQNFFFYLSMNPRAAVSLFRVKPFQLPNICE
jgi:hypothetical protein